jgi:hypothetical protein
VGVASVGGLREQGMATSSIRSGDGRADKGPAGGGGGERMKIIGDKVGN